MLQSLHDIKSSMLWLGLLTSFNMKYVARIIIKHFYASRYVINHKSLLLQWVIVILHQIKIDDFSVSFLSIDLFLFFIRMIFILKIHHKIFTLKKTSNFAISFKNFFYHLKFISNFSYE